MHQSVLTVSQQTDSGSVLSSLLTKVVACFAALLMWSQPHKTHADEKPAEGTVGIVVRVRAVRAVGVMPPPEVQGVAAVERVALGSDATSPQISCGTKQRWDSALDDIGSKLKALHYRDYKMAASQAVIVPLMKKRAVYLHDGNVLLVRPLYADAETIGLWLRWVDGAGTRLLDTRMHFNERETMLTGTELSATDADGGGAATVLAIDVKAAP